MQHNGIFAGWRDLDDGVSRRCPTHSYQSRVDAFPPKTLKEPLGISTDPSGVKSGCARAGQSDRLIESFASSEDAVVLAVQCLPRTHEVFY